jgi:hypothetical protein
VGEQDHVVAEEPLGRSFHMKQVVDIGGNAAEDAGQELHDQGALYFLVLEMVIQNIEVSPRSVHWASNIWTHATIRASRSGDRPDPTRCSIRSVITPFIPQTQAGDDNHAGRLNQVRCIDRAGGDRASGGGPVWSGGAERPVPALKCEGGLP